MANIDDISLKQPPKINNNATKLPSVLSNSHYIKAATSENTRSTYRSAVRQFQKWGALLPCDESRIIQYLVDKAPLLNSRTLDLHLSAIKQWHLTQGFVDPTQSIAVKKTMEGIRRTHGKPKSKAKALRLEHIAALLSHLQSKPESKKKKRDIALLLIGFFGAFRRSELAKITIEDIEWEEEGLTFQLDKSKTDQSAEGKTRSIPSGLSSICPVIALKEWLDIAEITTGPIFRGVNRWDQLSEKAITPSAINLWLKSLGEACDFDFIAKLSSHSFRRGLSTSAAREKIDFELIKKQGGWKNDATVWEYIDEGQRFTDNAAVELMHKMSLILDD